MGSDGHLARRRLVWKDFAVPVGPMQILIVAVVVIVLFGTGKLAGLGKSAGRSLREFKEETRGLSEPAPEQSPEPAPEAAPEPTSDATAPATRHSDE